jgi:uncharacterized protein
MKIENSFEVGSPIDRTWDALTDLQRIAPCMPGARLTEVDGEEYRGAVKVKVGPITQSFEGTARFAELDRSAYRAVIVASGHEQRGQGTASATITTALEPAGGGTRVLIDTDLSITGRAAQFGRGLLQDVSTILLRQFVERLETDVLAQPEQAEGTAAAGDTPSADAAQAPAAAAATASSPDASQAPALAGVTARQQAAVPRAVSGPPPEALDLAALAAGSLIRRLVPVVAAVAVVLAVTGAVSASWSVGRWLMLASIVLVSGSVAALATVRGRQA